MVSINSSANAYVLSNLRQINNDLSTAQVRIGTGKKVNSSSDNASVFAIAQGIRADQKAQDGLTTGISLAKGRSDTAVAALDSVVKLLGEIKTLALDAKTNADYSVLNTKTAALNKQITTTAASASFQGKNWLALANTDASATVTIGSSSGTPQTLAVALEDVTSGTLATFTTAVAITVDDATKAATLAGAVDTAVTALTSYQAKLSTFSGSLGSQQDFLKALSVINNTALSTLVDADLTEESAKVTALQTQQQLAYQAIAIGNSSASNILALFR